VSDDTIAVFFTKPLQGKKNQIFRDIILNYHRDNPSALQYRSELGDMVWDHIVPADERSGTNRDYKTGRTNTERIKRELEKVKIHKVMRLKEESLERRIHREAEAAAK
jgi:hypothetical protein